MGQVTALFVAPAAGEPMEARELLEAVDGGFVGDRYLTGRGYYAPYDVCQVTLVESEALAAVRVGDAVELTTPDPREMGRRIADRRRERPPARSRDDRASGGPRDDRTSGPPGDEWGLGES
jgi:hypothetical protein